MTALWLSLTLALYDDSDPDYDREESKEMTPATQPHTPICGEETAEPAGASRGSQGS